MAKKVLTTIKLQAVGGQASPAPPVGPALGQHGINIMEFCKAFNAQTQQETGTVIPVEITVFEDRSFTFVTKSPPAAVLIKQAIGLDKGSGEPNRDKVGTVSRDQVREIAELALGLVDIGADIALLGLNPDFPVPPSLPPRLLGHPAVGWVSAAGIESIAERKKDDLNANDLDAAVKIVAGTARSMGVDVSG